MEVDTFFEASSTMDLVSAPAQSSHISRIPKELLLDIIDMVPSPPDAKPYITSIALSHVSHLWRELALCSPQLWTDISIHERFVRPITRFPATLYRVYEFLKRSGKLPLSVDITIVGQLTILEHFTTDTAFPKDLEVFRKGTSLLSDVLAAHVWRFKSFSLVCDEFPFIVQIQSKFPVVAMPFLESWHVRQTYGGELAFEGDLEDVNDLTALRIPLRPEDATDEYAAAMFPRLRSAVFCATPMKWARFCPRNLTTLELSFLPMQGRPNGEAFRNILLANEHSLVSLKIYGAAPTSKVQLPYTMSKLERLELGYAFPDELIPLVEDIQFPNLTSLVIEDLYRSSTPDFVRDQLEYDHTTAVLFECMTRHFPLRQVKNLELRHICLIPPLTQNNPSQIPIMLVPDFSGLIIPISSFDFFCELMALMNLTLINPDVAILFTLSYIPVETENSDSTAAHSSSDEAQGSGASSSTSDDSEPLRLPVPALTSLHIEDFDQDLVRLFLMLRTTENTSYPRLSKLTFGSPNGCMDTSDSWMKSIMLLTDIFTMAEACESVESERFYPSNVEVQLGAIHPYY